uniref:Uncharacterized protein n=1 Tax=Panagrolaimus superbus TaxID=310955 RepID=A0A914ZAE4_9BILA
MAAEPAGESSVIAKESAQEPMEEDAPQPPVIESNEGNNPASAAVDVPIAPENINNVTFHNHYHQLQDKELDNGFLSVDEYIELFLAEVVQNLDCARQTLSRGKLQYPKESMFVSVQGFLCFNYADDFTGTLKKIKAVRKRLPKFERYITEIQHRIFAYGIASIVNCYSTVKLSTLAHMLDISIEQEMVNLLKMFNWSADNGIVQVSNTPQLQAFLNEQISPEFGIFNGFEKFRAYANLSRRKEYPIDNLKKLMQVSDTLSKISLPPITGKNGSLDQEANEDRPPQPSFSIA